MFQLIRQLATRFSICIASRGFSRLLLLIISMMNEIMPFRRKITWLMCLITRDVGVGGRSGENASTVQIT